MGGWADDSSILTATRMIDHPFSTPPLTSSPHHICTSIVCFPGYGRGPIYLLFPKGAGRPDGVLVPSKVRWLADPFPRHQDRLARLNAGARGDGVFNVTSSCWDLCLGRDYWWYPVGKERCALNRRSDNAMWSSAAM